MEIEDLETNYASLKRGLRKVQGRCLALERKMRAEAHNHMVGFKGYELVVKTLMSNVHDLLISNDEQNAQIARMEEENETARDEKSAKREAALEEAVVKARKYPIIEYLESADHNNPIPVLIRQNKRGSCNPCPFCGEEHLHGPEDGHREANCRVAMEFQKGLLTFNNRNGYIVRTVGPISEPGGNTQ